jgi:polyisoprenoid-binding protein YceI
MRLGPAVLALAIPAFAATYTFDMAPAKSKVEWTVTDVLHTVHGTFKLKRGTIDFDPESGKASGQIVVDVASGNSGSDARDRRMHANVLESAKYPEAFFVPDQIEGALTIPGTSNFKLRGMLTIHGAAHEINVAVRTKATVDQMNAAITFDIPYVAWGMKDPSNFLFKVNKTVPVSIEASGTILKN